MNARRRHLRAAACLTLVGLLACLPLAAAFGSVNEDDMVLRLSAAERALPPDRLPDFDASCARSWTRTARCGSAATPMTPRRSPR